MRHILCLLSLLFIASAAQGQEAEKIDPEKDNTRLIPVGLTKSSADFKGKKAIKVVASTPYKKDQFVKIEDLEFKNGVIELEVAGMPSADATEQARGFIGLAFRIDETNEKLECIYLRPTNGRAEDQVRRNHSVQYVSHPDYPWHRLRKEHPKMYETYVDLVPGEWTKIRIEVEGQKARLYVHGASQPTLIINDLKHGEDVSGKIGLWIGPGTEGYFSDIKITAL